VILPCDVTPYEFLCQLADEFPGNNAVGEATREAPAQTEGSDGASPI
jgi:hypothetical protein